MSEVIHIFYLLLKSVHELLSTFVKKSVFDKHLHIVDSL